MAPLARILVGKLTEEDLRTAFRQAAGQFNAGALGTATASATVGVNSATITVPLSLLRSVQPALSTIRVVGLNDETRQFIPAENAYLSLSFPAAQYSVRSEPSTASSGSSHPVAIAIVIVVVAAFVAVDLAAAVVAFLRRRAQPAGPSYVAPTDA